MIHSLRAIKAWLSKYPAPFPLHIQGMRLSHLPLRMYWHGVHEAETTSYIQKIVKKDWVCVDVGAFVGYYTVMLSKLAKKVYAFEPSPRTHQYMLENLRQNNCDNVIVFNAAVSDQKGVTSFFIKNGGSGTDSIAISESKSEIVAVDTLALDDAVIGRIDLVKIDAEGADLLVLNGMSRIIRENPALKIVLEFSPRYIKSIKHTADTFFDTLQAKGLKVGWISEGGEVSYDLDFLREMRGGHVNLLLQPVSFQ